MARQYLLDRTWAGHAFLAPASALSDSVNNTRRYYTASSRKFIDTSMGGHFAINPLSQFTENCDLKHKSIYSGSQGMGRWYSDVLDDNAQLIHIRAGVPKFNSMNTFFGNFYNVYAGAMSRTGRAPDVWFRVGEVAGVIGTLPFQPFILMGSMFKFFTGMPRSKYYYLKPTMYPYWYAVSNFVNAMFVNMGMSPHFVNDEQKRLFDPLSVPDKTDSAEMARILPNIVNPDGGIDMFAISTKAQRMANVYRDMVDERLSGLSADPAKRAEEFNRIMNQGIDDGIKKMRNPGASLKEYEKAYLAFSGKYDPTKATTPDNDDNSQGFISKFYEQAKAEARMGAEFVTFRVNNTGTNSDSFSNQVGEPSIKSEINAMSSKARSARFNLADGNLTGILGDVTQAAASVMAGVLSSLQVEGFMALAGNAFVEIQKMYENSSADLNRTSFTIPLRAWAADDWVRMKNIFIPLGAILALGLPRATGRASYDGPFLLEIWNQGRTQIREGMVESISIERGVGDVGYAKGGKVLGIDVTVNIVDMSSIMSMPINPGFSPVEGAVKLAAQALGGSVALDVANAVTASTYAEDNKYTDYLATLGGLSLEVQTRSYRKWQLNMARSRAEFNQWKSPYRAASWAMSGVTGDIIRLVSRPTDRP